MKRIHGVLRVIRSPLPCIAVLMGCTAEPESEPAATLTPVSIVELRVTDPSVERRFTGLVEAWRQEQVGFNIGGRVDWVIEEGTDVEGESHDENDNLLTSGTVIARLDETRYRLALRTAQSRLETANIEIEAAKVQLRKVIPAQLKAAKAEHDSAKREYERIGDLVRMAAAATVERDKAETTLATAQANLEQYEALKTAKQAELEGIVAQAKQAEAALNQAEVDVEDCRFVAPFRAKVAKVHLNRGAIVQPGQAVVTLLAMDPLKIVVAVSGGTARSIGYGDIVKVFPAEQSEAKLGWIYLKDSVADPATRTFDITVLVRNHRIYPTLPPEVQPATLPRIAGISVLERENQNVPGPYYVLLDALFKDDQTHFVWKIEGRRIGRQQQSFSPLMKLRRVPVVPGEKRVNLFGFIFRELRDQGDIAPYELLAHGVADDVKDGDQVLFIREEWLFRPRDVASVSLAEKGPGPGFYVPMEAIVQDEGRHHVYLVVHADGGSARAKRVEVQLAGEVGKMWRIEGEQIVENSRVVIEGARHLIDGMPVRVMETLEVRP